MQNGKKDYNKSLSVQNKKSDLFFISISFSIPFLLMSTLTLQSAAFISSATIVSIFLGQFLFVILTEKLALNKFLSAGICTVVNSGIITLFNVLVQLFVPILAEGRNNYVYLLCAISPILALEKTNEKSLYNKFISSAKIVCLFVIELFVVAIIREFLIGSILIFTLVENVFKLESSSYPFFAFILCGYLVAIVSGILFRSKKEKSSDEEAA